MEKYKNTEERREKTIRSIFLKADLPTKIIHEATSHALLHARSYPKSLSIAAGIGLFVATKARSIPYSVDEISELVGADRRQLRRRVTKVTGVPSDTGRMKEAHLAKILSRKPYLHPKVIDSAYRALPHQEASNPQVAAKKALKAGKEEYQKSLLEGFNSHIELPQKQSLLPAKCNSIFSQPKQRVLGFLDGLSMPQNDVHPLLLLEQEKELLDRSLDLNLYNFMY